jgi:hypothetical protein
LSDFRLLSLPINDTDGVQWPISISLDWSRGRLYVGDNETPYRVLIYDNVFNLTQLSHKHRTYRNSSTSFACHTIVIIVLVVGWCRMSD